MAEPIVNVDPRIYGGDAPTGNAVPEFDPMGSAPVQAAAPAPEQVSQDLIGVGTPSYAVGQNVAALNAREVSSVGSAAVAATKTWSPVRVWDYINMPNFDETPGFDPKPYVNSVPFVMSEDEQRFMAQSKSVDEFNYRLQNTQDQRKLYAQLGDHPLVSTLVGLADPGYLALDLASMGVAAGAGALGAGIRAQRIAAGAAGAGSTFALGEAQSQVVPMSDTEIILPALMSGAANALFYRPKRGLVAHDPEYPVDDLNRAVQGVQGETQGAERRVVAEQQTVAEATPTPAQDTVRMSEQAVAPPAGRAIEASADQAVEGAMHTRQLDSITLERFGVNGEVRGYSDAYTALLKHTDDPTFGPMIRTLQEEQGDLLQRVRVADADVVRGKLPSAFYTSADHTVYMHPMVNDPFTVLHESVHGLTTSKIEYGMQNPGTAHGKLVQQLDLLRDQVLDAIQKSPSKDPHQQYMSHYFAGDLHEFVAGLFSGDTHFTRTLASLPATGSRNTLTRMVDTVRKLLGIPPAQENALTKALGLTDELMKSKPTLVADGLGEVTYHAPTKVPTGTQSQQAATIVKRMEGAAAKTGQAISWSLHKTVSGISTAGKKVADLLVDDPVHMTGDSVTSQKVAIRSDLAQLQYVYEDALKAEMSKRGAGLRNRIFSPRQSSQIQRNIEREVYDELQRRNNVVRRGGNINDPSVNPSIAKMADAHDRATAAGLREMKSAGVLGADAVEEAAGYTPRKWSVTQIEHTEGRFQQAGMTERQAKTATRDLVAKGIKAANPDWEDEVVRTVSSALIERARRKGYFEDQALRGHVGDAGAKEIRDILAASGSSDANIQRAMDVITGVNDEAGKSANLKHRIDLDTTASAQVGDGTSVSIADLLDTNVARNLDNYLDNSAGNAALARKGLASTSDIAKLRTEFLQGVESESKRKDAAALFDNTIASIKGQPAGEALADGMRKLAAVTQMVGLSSSGLWQVTEYANAMAKYGLLKTTREIMRTMPVFRSLMTDPHAEGGAENLARVLSRNSSQDLRIRPYIQKMEDNFEMDLGDHGMLVAQQAKQMVPYINAMHYIHHNQANVVGNLVADVFHQGANGSAKAREALAKYGLEGHTLDSVASDIKAHGLDTSAWSDATWQQIRGPLNKMMDDAVLKNRTGEIPAFAQFSSVGKFIFTFRSFVLGAHNKVLAGTAGREGFGGVGLLMAYQFPLTMLATQANSALRGQKPEDLTRTAVLALQQMGAMGLFGDVWGIASGDKQQFGASGLMAIDRLYKTGSAVATGNWGTAASGAVNSIPLLSIVPGVKGMAETLKTDPNHKH